MTARIRRRKIKTMIMKPRIISRITTRTIIMETTADRL